MMSAKLFSNGSGKMYMWLYTEKEGMDDKTGEWNVDWRNWV